MSVYDLHKPTFRKIETIENDLYTYLFYVRVPEQMSRNPSDIKLLGTYKSGSEEIDRQMMNNWISVYIPAVKIADYFQNGIGVKLTRNTEIQKLYDLYNEFCHYWAEALTMYLNISKAPIDDLILYDRVAGEIFEIAKYEFDLVLPVPTDVKTLLGGNNLGGLTVFNQQLHKAAPEELKHPSLADLFKKHALGVIRR